MATVALANPYMQMGLPPRKRTEPALDMADVLVEPIGPVSNAALIATIVPPGKKPAWGHREELPWGYPPGANPWRKSGDPR